MLSICLPKDMIKTQSTHMSINRMYKLWFICVMANYTAKGMNKPQLHVTTWINFTHKILSGKRQNQKVDIT